MARNLIWLIVGVTLTLLVGGIILISKGQKSPETVVLATETSQRMGAENGNVTLVEFGDFECPSCKAYEPVVRQLVDEFPNNLTFVYRNYPLPQHRSARWAAIAAEAAALQGKYWEMHRKLFETQGEWANESNPQEVFAKYAEEVGMDKNKFAADMTGEEIAKKVQSDVTDGNGLGVNSTPTFYLNGKRISNPGSAEDFRALIQGIVDNSPISQAPQEKYHAHADIRVYLRGKMVDFTQNKYQSSEEKELSPDIHFHDGMGEVFHMHTRGVPISALFTSLGMELTDTCLMTDDKTKYCKNETENLNMYVNGQKSDKMAEYVPMDLDQVLITYGSETQEKIDQQIKSISDKACIYSEKCPERGTPPTENCVGGLGTECKAQE